MKKNLNWPSVYAYLVCLVMLIAIIVVGSRFIHSALDFVFPATAVPQSELIKPIPELKNVTVTPEAEQLYRQAQEQYMHQNQVKGMLSGALGLLVVVPFYLYHWRLAGKFRSFEGEITVRDIYFYLASLITLVISVISLLTAIDTLIPLMMKSLNYIPPLETLYYKNGSVDTQTAVTITKEQVQTLLSQAQANNGYPRDSLIRELTALIVAGPLYLLHWKTTKKLHA